MHDRIKPTGALRQLMDEGGVVEGDLLDWAREGSWIAHQCNCTTKGARGLAQAIFKRWPHADIYSHRHHPDTPGTVESQEGDLFVKLVMMPVLLTRVDLSTCDPPQTSEVRLQWFRACLNEIASKEDVIKAGHTVAFPYNIGCALAGGSWPAYRQALEDFAACAPHLQVVIVKLPEKKGGVKRPREVHG